MDLALIAQITQANPWLSDPNMPILPPDHFIPRIQAQTLIKPDWDNLWTILVGPRQAGKTTLGKFLCQELIKQHRFKQLLYLNCDYPKIREWVNQPEFLQEATSYFKLENFILFIDEVQRLETPGLLLKIIADLRLPIKMMASGSSQLEIKSKVQEFLTGRQFEMIILPLSCREIDFSQHFNNIALYGSYPQIYQSQAKVELLQQLFESYISKDIIEFLRLGKPDIMRKLVGLIAHSSGQLINYQQFATDCQISFETIRNYLDILEKTYVIKIIKPYVGNKRTELTANPICYFIDDGFRNQALNNFSPLNTRTDAGLLIQNLVFQELYKFQTQTLRHFDIHYWRTKGGAEVDFVIAINQENIIPIEVKYQTFKQLNVSRGLRSFVEAYQPKHAFVINKNIISEITIDQTVVHFVPITEIKNAIEMLETYF